MKERKRLKNKEITMETTKKNNKKNTPETYEWLMVGLNGCAVGEFV